MSFFPFYMSFYSVLPLERGDLPRWEKLGKWKKESLQIVYMHKKFMSTSQNFDDKTSRKQMTVNWDRISLQKQDAQSGGELGRKYTHRADSLVKWVRSRWPARLLWFCISENGPYTKMCSILLVFSPRCQFWNGSSPGKQSLSCRPQAYWLVHIHLPSSLFQQDTRYL